MPQPPPVGLMKGFYYWSLTRLWFSWRFLLLCRDPGAPIPRQKWEVGCNTHNVFGTGRHRRQAWVLLVDIVRWLSMVLFIFDLDNELVGGSAVAIKFLCLSREFYAGILAKDSASSFYHVTIYDNENLDMEGILPCVPSSTASYVLKIISIQNSTYKLRSTSLYCKVQS